MTHDIDFQMSEQAPYNNLRLVIGYKFIICIVEFYLIIFKHFCIHIHDTDFPSKALCLVFGIKVLSS